ncbi:DNA recombinase, putative [Heliomicrobium modesticaldum Ice1]|uniref:DNA recombinase, putative n=1 Tax=Heliobacterium modesticaldum (strain ATCC 51547 / Ice1) TaxID=498761 RepID=B0TCI3_HELMI|nr:recombinase family protein [Heliomicrobium modesticaldum]ABZ85371.1 DNA recombinase, putative [Heliomicrobium modesticaldum Ice1]
MAAAKTVSVIPAKPKQNRTAEANARQKLRVAAYCRVSTDNEEQASSYEVQIEHYTRYIQSNPEWELAGIFADEGITGTNTKKRAEFNRMIEECMAGRIDMVITKSISRFARNTLDCLKYIRQLKDKGIPVFFEKENINTMDSKGEILLTIMASLAQQESQSLSQNVRMGIAFRFQNGEIQVNHNRFLGYTKDENKRLVIVPEEAEIVKRIYREFLEGASLLQIGRGLEADGILTAAGKPKWRPETIRKILKNEKYIGDALLQKTYTVDFLSKKRVINNGIVPQYYVENSHEPIIPRELFLQVQEELARRANLRSGEKGGKRVYSSKYALSSIVFCGECGEIYRRVHWNNRGKKSIVWRCVSRLEEKGSDCGSPTVSEEDLQKAVLKAINSIIAGRDEFIETLRRNIETALGGEFDESTEAIDKKLEELQHELLRLASTKAAYDSVANEIYRLRELRQETLASNSERQNKRQRIAEMMDFLESQSGVIFEYDEKLVRWLVEKVTVFEGGIVVKFKTGISVELDYR